MFFSFTQTSNWLLVYKRVSNILMFGRKQENMFLLSFPSTIKHISEVTIQILLSSSSYACCLGMEPQCLYYYCISLYEYLNKTCFSQRCLFSGPSLPVIEEMALGSQRLLNKLKNNITLRSKKCEDMC